MGKFYINDYITEFYLSYMEKQLELLTVYSIFGNFDDFLLIFFFYDN